MDTSLLDDLKRTLGAAGLSDEAQERVLKDLDEAVAANLLTRLLGSLSEKDEEEFRKQEFTDIEGVTEFMKTRLDAETVEKALAEAADEVLDKFLTRLEAQAGATS